MRIHIIIHASFEKPGVIEEWAIENKHSLSFTNTYAGEKLPSSDEFDFLVIMGGPQSPLKLERYPYLKDEIELAKQAIKQNKYLLGICLGAQIIGEALGAKTQRSPEKEIGVYPVQVTEEGATDPIFKHFAPVFNAMHWHNDMPGIVNGMKLLAKSQGCPQQAFNYGNRVYGLQFHLEPTKAVIEEMLGHCQGDLTPNKYVQTPAEILKADFTSINDRMKHILNTLTKS